MNDYQLYIAKSRYARWDDKLKRRETWGETVARYADFFTPRITTAMQSMGYKEADIADLLADVSDSIVTHKVMPSMRCLMTAGKALDRDNVAGYNCAYTPIDHPRCFDEAMYVLLCGTGVGFSVERQHINKLPDVAEEFYDTDTVINVKDSKIGWASATRELIALLYSGRIPTWDLSKVRPAGARLKTFGGRASGPEPLNKLFCNLVRVFKLAAGRKLTSLECHDILCYIADTVVVGGVRRSACISLSNLSDDRMRSAKYGEWYHENPQRMLANNSVAYTEKPDFRSFLKEWETLYKSRAGERGIVNRKAFKKKCRSIGRDDGYEFAVNPCGEVILRPHQFCNLTEAVIRSDDTLDTLKKKVEIATILGTLQATLTDFRYLRPIWKKNTEEEALLGVSLTGIMDNVLMSGADKEVTKNILIELRKVVHETNKKWAKIFGINPAAACTVVKPSGTVSQLVDCSSGIHPRMYPYYIRTVANDKKDPIAQFMIESGVPCKEEADKYYFKFPMKAPENAVTAHSISSIEQLELWKLYADYWCDHNPSQTIYYTDDSFLAVGQWVWENFDSIGGLSFFPKIDSIYENNPYVEITKEKYEELYAAFPKDLDWEKASAYENTDETTGTMELSCSGGQCEIV